MPKQVNLIIKPQWILPIVPANQLFQDCALIVDRGLITALLPNAEADRLYQAKEEVVLPNQVLMPGLVNAHGHAAMTLLRGYADDLPLKTWLNDHIWPTESRLVSEDFVRDGTRHAIAEMLKSGTTCFSDQYFFPEIVAEASVQAGIRCRIAFPVFEFPSAWGQGPDEYIHKGLSLRDDYKNHPLIGIAFGPHAPYTLEDASLQRIAVLAEELDAHIQIHLHETAQEVADSLKLHGVRPIERMENLGILGPRTETVHMTQLIDSDIELLARYNSTVVHCPRSNLKLASGLCPVARLRDSGITLGLGTDGAASNNSLDMFKELNQASLLAKVVAEDAEALNAFESLKMATLDSAKVLGLDKQIGSLETGKKADMISISLDGLEVEPVYHIASQLAYASQSSQVRNSWIDGRQVLAEGQLASLNEQEIRARSREWAQKITGNL